MHGLKILFVPCKENEYRPRLLGRIGITALLALMLAVEGFLVASVIVRHTGTGFLAAVEEGALITLTNGDRASYALPPLRSDSRLNAVAQGKARDMAQRGYFSHTGPRGEEPWVWITGAGYAYEYAGENLAVHFSDSADVEQAWMASPTHQANILKRQYADIGVGVAQGYFDGESATYVVQYFASPKGEPLARGTAVEKEDSSLPPPEVEEERAIAGALTPGQTINPAAASASSEANSFVRTFLRAAASPERTAALALGGITTLLVFAVGLTVVLHMRIQPGQLLMGGATLAAIGLVFLTLNNALLPSSTMIEGQAASVVLAPIEEEAPASTSPAVKKPVFIE